MKKHILMVLILIAAFGYIPLSHGQTEQSKEPKAIVDDFFKAFSEGKFEAAIVGFFNTNPWMEKKQDMLETLKPKYAGLPSVAGKYIGSKILKTETAENILRIKAAAYFDRQPILIVFVFYKSGEVWRGQDIDVKFDEAFDEILKIQEK